jgi:hypothetical protein
MKPRVVRTRKVKDVLMSMTPSEIMRSGITWVICKGVR